jgi:hypothetical protein
MKFALQTCCGVSTYSPIFVGTSSPGTGVMSGASSGTTSGPGSSTGRSGISGNESGVSPGGTSWGLFGSFGSSAILGSFQPDQLWQTRECSRRAKVERRMGSGLGAAIRRCRWRMEMGRRIRGSSGRRLGNLRGTVSSPYAAFGISAFIPSPRLCRTRSPRPEISGKSGS